jgi:hypothetical protein
MRNTEQSASAWIYRVLVGITSIVVGMIMGPSHIDFWPLYGILILLGAFFIARNTAWALFFWFPTTAVTFGLTFNFLKLLFEDTGHGSWVPMEVAFTFPYALISMVTFVVCMWQLRKLRCPNTVRHGDCIKQA